MTVPQCNSRFLITAIFNPFYYAKNTREMKKALRETQTLRDGYSIKVEPKIFTQPQTPYPVVQDGQN